MNCFVCDEESDTTICKRCQYEIEYGEECPKCGKPGRGLCVECQKKFSEYILTLSRSKLELSKEKG